MGYLKALVIILSRLITGTGVFVSLRYDSVNGCSATTYTDKEERNSLRLPVVAVQPLVDNSRVAIATG